MAAFLDQLVAAFSNGGHNGALRQLLDYAQPLLRQLSDVAPGTFQHSVNVGVLADAAARSIQANALLARVGALYHDVGKTRAPLYFVENQTGENPHERLRPEESVRILRAHVIDGVEMIRASGLNPRLADFIREHHGTSLMRLFVAKAEAGGSAAPPELFRYPGPRPRSAETAIVMIADQLEATGRATPPRTEGEAFLMVGAALERIQLEQQLTDAELSRRAVQSIHASLARALHAMHHHRMRYPPPTQPLRSALAGVKAALRRPWAG